ncbi:MAG: hypothetical protein RLZZ480_906 [Candidatus Parcubacteria bacterium]|jgi:hypothetical protein
MNDLIPEYAKDILDGDEFSELTDIIPWVKTGAAAFKYVKKKRIENFFKSLNILQEDFNEVEKIKLKEYLTSDAGFNLLGEYIDKVHQTSSSIVSCALAILLVSESEDLYTDDFKLAAINGLVGIDDVTVDAFLELTKPAFLERRLCDSGGPYPVYMVEVETANGETDPEKIAKHAEMLIGYVNFLTVRGLLLPDYATSRLGGEKTKIQPYGVGVRTKEYRDLLCNASELIKKL